MWWLVLLAVGVGADLPTLDNTKWGCDDGPEGEITPFKITFDDEMIADLRMRLSNHRRPVPTFEGVNHRYGFNSYDLERWIQYWREEYDFKKREEALNKYPQYKVRVQGLNIHFIKVEPVNKTKRKVTLLLLHGWPGSIREFYDVIPGLVADHDSRDFAIEVIIPSLPGFGFSDAACIPGLGGVEMAVVLRNAMKILGYEKYIVQGGDWGSYIGSAMTTMYPKEVIGFHTNLPTASTSKAFMLMAVGHYFPDLVVDSSLSNRIYPLLNKTLWLLQETAYFHFMATKPETIGIAMTDSPAGFMSFFLQCISGGTRKVNPGEPEGGLLKYYTREQLIDNLMMYWTDNKITTSSRLYYETIRSKNGSQVMSYPTDVPTWALQAPDEIIYMSPIMLATKYKNLRHATVLDNGGHFLALERPAEFGADVLRAVTEFVRWDDLYGY
ncbi:juvenile hormone epoxide hydrolase-like [Manduca sexta]|uniref:juvenile hormone epoxide hydrolase-like n=1 Tax=Manduca sexta TaxID=7130 RepID=UPI0018906210|nr:juvenile hormone epoxide hydrolase-like [Manduca sexta]